MSTRISFAWAALILVVPLESQESKEPEAVKRARLKLDDNPKDPEANLTLGKYLAFERNEWENGIAFIAKGSDELLKAVAEKDLANPKDPKDQVKLGDAWIELAKKKAPFRAKAEGRAQHWYQTAWPLLEDPEKEPLRKIFYKIAAPPADYDKPPKKKEGFPAGWEFGHGTNGFPETTFARTGKGSGKILPAPDVTNRQANLCSVQYPTVPGKKYKLSGWVYTDKTDADGQFDIGFWDKAGKLFGFGDAPPIHMDQPYWKRIEKNGVVPDEAFRIQVRPWSQHTKGAVWIDDVSLVVDGKDLLKNGGFEDK